MHLYPEVIIDLGKFRTNVRHMLEMSHNLGLTMMAVSKVFCADSKLVKILIEENVDYIADSRIENLKQIKTTIPKVLLRLPMQGEVDDVVKFSDISLNSEISTIKLLNEKASENNKKHGVIIMIDLGDLREGIFNRDEVFSTVKEILKLDNIELKGIGVNLTCYGGVIPTTEIMDSLVTYKNEIEEEFDIRLEIISGGNSSSIGLIQTGQMPIKVNNLRLGESIVLGRETAYGGPIKGTHDDVFTLATTIIELKEKPSMPIGEIGMNAFGKKPSFVDKGLMKRAIIGIGRQDVNHEDLIPYDSIEAIGSSSDHIILDVTKSYGAYEVGDIVLFKLTYGSILSLMTSKYVHKKYIG